jgi:hypothetical protein
LGTLLQGYLDTSSIHDFKFPLDGDSGGIVDIDAVSSDAENTLTVMCDLMLPGTDSDYDGTGNSDGPVVLVDAVGTAHGKSYGATRTSDAAPVVSAHHLRTGM